MCRYIYTYICVYFIIKSLPSGYPKIYLIPDGVGCAFGLARVMLYTLLGEAYTYAKFLFA
jgi:hypothetical protein